MKTKIKILIIILIVALLLIVGTIIFISSKKSKAKEIILEDVNALRQDIDIIESGLDFDDFKITYKMEFYYQNIKYEYEVNLLTNEIIKSDQEGKTVEPKNNEINNTPSVNNNPTTGVISAEDAKRIALEDAKVPSESINNIIVKTNDPNEYDIEFYFDQTKYEYEIDTNGNIINSEKERINS